MQITIYRTDDGYTLHPHLGIERLEMTIADDVQVREEPLRGTVRVYHPGEAGISVDRALALGWLEPATYGESEEPEGHPYRDLLYSMMNLRAA